MLLGTPWKPAAFEPRTGYGFGVGGANVAELPIPLQIQVDLRMISTAFQILEKYGRNLLHPRKPYFWRMVKFNNPVFRDTVDTIQVSHPTPSPASQMGSLLSAAVPLDLKF